MDSKYQPYIEAVAEAAPTYQPSLQVTNHLHHVTLVAIIGPFCSGKTTIMDATAQIDDSFGRVRGFTTRPQREGESTEIYDFIPHDERNLKEIQSQIEKRELVQFFVHPTGYVYGTRPRDYAKPYNLLAAVPESIEQLQTLPFGNVIKVGLCSQPGIWQQRINERRQTSSEVEIRKRMEEGAENLEWSLHQDDLAWLENSSQAPGQVATQLISISKKPNSADPAVKKIAQNMLRAAGSLLQ